MEREIVKLAVCRPKNKTDSCLRDAKASMIILTREARRALQGESMAPRNLSDAEMERDRTNWDTKKF